LIEGNSAEKIAVALSDLYHAQTTITFSFGEFIQYLIKDYPEKAYDVYILLKEKNMPLIYLYGSNFLREFRSQKRLNEFYWKEIDNFKLEGTPDAYKLMLNIYCCSWASKNYFSKKDAELIKSVLPHYSEKISYNIVNALPTLYLINPAESIHYIESFLRNCTELQASLLFQYLFNLNIKDNDLYELFFKESIRFPISHEMESCLLKISKSNRSDDLFLYFKKRFDYKKSLLGDDSAYYRYEFIPFSQRGSFKERLGVEQKIFFFGKSLEWFAFLKGGWEQLHTAQNLLVYLQPSQELAEDLNHHYYQLFKACADDGEALLNLIDSLAIFHIKTSELIEMVSLLLENCKEKFGNDASFMEDVNYKSYDAIMSAGVKTGTPGEPFLFDVQLKKLIEEVLPGYEKKPSTRNLLQSLINSLNQNIIREKVVEKEDW
jgi:hypothetical protein